MSTVKKINKILIANRGEIAIRIMRTCKELGIRTVAIFSESDRNAPHVLFADEAYYVGESPAKESYLQIERITDVASKAKVDAIHPGYGFLSENEDFVESVEKAGIIFIGPTADAMLKLGDKTHARKIAKSAGVPIAPGTEEPISNEQEAALICDSIGYPILLKAAGGGGGKGMRVVRSREELTSAIQGAKSEAGSAFNDDRVFIEKYIENPRHIEVQILADHFGNIVHLGERECSIQRRHQKIIEESPSIAVDNELRKQLTDSAISLIRATNYTNAGTIEFLLSGDRSFYFLEVNTRLQVEHPVTEMVTGIDIVKEQIRIAENQPLSFAQDEIQFRGHSIETRIYAEDPANSFFPSTGKIFRLKSSNGPGVREDRGIEVGDEVTPYYDPLLSKVISFGINRNEALNRMIRILEEYELFGVENNINFCKLIFNHPKFQDGDFNTHFIDKYFSDITLQNPPEHLTKSAMLAALCLKNDNSTNNVVNNTSNNGAHKSLWKAKRNEQYR